MQRVVLAIPYIWGLIVTTLHDTSIQHYWSTSLIASMQRPGICLITKPFSHTHFLLRFPSLFDSIKSGSILKLNLSNRANLSPFVTWPVVQVQRPNGRVVWPVPCDEALPCLLSIVRAPPDRRPSALAPLLMLPFLPHTRSTHRLLHLSLS